MEEKILRDIDIVSLSVNIDYIILGKIDYIIFVNIDDIIMFCNKIKKMNVNKKDIVSYWDCVIIFVV